MRGNNYTLAAGLSSRPGAVCLKSFTNKTETMHKILKTGQFIPECSGYHGNKPVSPSWPPHAFLKVLYPVSKHKDLSFSFILLYSFKIYSKLHTSVYPYFLFILNLYI